MTPQEKKAYLKAYREANKEKLAAQMKANYEKNRALRLLQAKAYREANKEKVAAYNKVWHTANREKALAQMRARYASDKEYYAAASKAWREANKAKAAEMRRANKTGCAVPSWVDRAACVHFYELARNWNDIWPEDPVDVDHIVPVGTKDKSVCGLHVPWNLQILRRSDNCSKKDSYDSSFILTPT